MVDFRHGSEKRKVCVVSALDLAGIRREFDYLYQDPDLEVSNDSTRADFYLVDVSHPIDRLPARLVQGNYARSHMCKPVLLISSAEGQGATEQQLVTQVESFLQCSLPVYRGEAEVRPAVDWFKQFVFPSLETLSGETQAEATRMTLQKLRTL